MQSTKLVLCSRTTLRLVPKRSFSSHSSGLDSRHVIAIRREDASIWERRAPLAPHHVDKLTKKGVRVLIQPSNRRAYPIQSYVRAGAEASEDISEAPVILGVKQVPRDKLLPSKTYCFFSHTIKGQEANMPLLKTVLDRKIRLIDYECLKDDKGERMVAFGKFAGYAGMINILHGIGLRLLALGHHTPFMHIGPAHNYRNVGAAKQAVRDAGYEIALGKMPRSIGPLTFVFTGTGNVSQGAQEVFSELPFEYVNPRDLKEVAEGGSTSKIYGTIMTRSDHLVRKQTAMPNGSSSFDYEEYNQHPDRYYSTFSKQVAPYASVIINGVFWEQKFPRLLTIPDAKNLQTPIKESRSAANSLERDNYLEFFRRSIGSPPLPHRLMAICDISADPRGSIEFMSKCSEIDKPFYLYDAENNATTEDLSQNGFLICSIDNMPTQLPLESTDMFGNLLLPYIYDIMRSDASKNLEAEQFSPVVERAIIASNGKLTPNFEYILEERQQFKPQDSKEVLVLGAGHVSGPLIEYLCSDPKIRVTVVALSERDIERLQPLATENNNLRSVIMNVAEEAESLSSLVAESDLVVSLLPFEYHPLVAKKCIQLKRSMVTTSYMRDEMRDLQTDSENAGITILNEIGLDPGIDHLLAKQVIDQVATSGGKITSFQSFCCGLPTPEFANNPLGYKFSWNPRGAFDIIMNGARWKEDDLIREAKRGELMDFAKDVDFFKGLSLEAFPNRDSISYQNLYNLPDAKTIIRGTLRYRGFSQTMNSLRMLGLLDQTPHPQLQPDSKSEITWPQLLAELLGHQQNISAPNLKMFILNKLNNSEERLKDVIECGLLEDEPVDKCGSLFESLREWIIKRYTFKKGENDLIIMKLMFGIEWADRKTEDKSLSMVVYGDRATGGFSAMAKTVGYPAAIAAKMLLDGEIQKKGMVVPLHPEIYHPVLKRLRSLGILVRE